MTVVLILRVLLILILVPSTTCFRNIGDSFDNDTGTDTDPDTNILSDDATSTFISWIIGPVLVH